jgi:hypothetical protein
MIKLNLMTCPNCGHVFYTDASYGRCDSCQCTFYAAQSRRIGSAFFTSAQPTPIAVQMEGYGEYVFVGTYPTLREALRAARGKA